MSLKETPTKLRREIEPRWVAEYCAKFYPKFLVKFREPLGPIPMSLKEKYGLTKGTRVFRPWRPEVDALIVAKDKLILIEAKLYRVYDAVAKLPIYKMLVPETPELSLWRHLPVEMQLLVVKITEPWKSIAEKVGIKLVDWAPSWVQEIFWERDLYWTREAIEMRERRKEVLKRLGFT